MPGQGSVYVFEAEPGEPTGAYWIDALQLRWVGASLERGIPSPEGFVEAGRRLRAAITAAGGALPCWAVLDEPGFAPASPGSRIAPPDRPGPPPPRRRGRPRKIPLASQNETA